MEVNNNNITSIKSIHLKLTIEIKNFYLQVTAAYDP